MIAAAMHTVKALDSVATATVPNNAKAEKLKPPALLTSTAGVVVATGVGAGAGGGAGAGAGSGDAGGEQYSFAVMINCPSFVVISGACENPVILIIPAIAEFVCVLITGLSYPTKWILGLVRPFNDCSMGDTSDNMAHDDCPAAICNVTEEAKSATKWDVTMAATS